MLQKLKNTVNSTLDKSKETVDGTVKYGKKLIRKKAIESIREKLEFALISAKRYIII